jgi:hypothetical protein
MTFILSKITIFRCYNHLREWTSMIVVIVDARLFYIINATNNCAARRDWKVQNVQLGFKLVAKDYSVVYV